MSLEAVMHRLAFVDLDTGQVDCEDPGDQVYADYLGGYGLGAHVLFNRQPGGVDALGPDNLLGILTGPLTGTDAITGNRFAAVGKSPRTGTWGDANCGGDFGPQMKQSGFDGAFFGGCADKWTYLFLEDGKAELRDATQYVGLDCVEVEAAFKADLGDDVRIACVGPAGERGSLIAAIINDGGRAAGRSGLGAVMAAKKIKAVVVRPTGEVPVADPEGMKALRKQILSEYFREGNPSYELFSNYGTCGITATSVSTGDAPIKNWAGAPADFPGAEKISDDAVIALQTKKYGCWRCPLACGGHSKVESGPFKMDNHKAEYETLGAFGSMCLNDNVESIHYANELCNRAGIDTISAGCTVAFAIECYERGIISREDTGGVELTWGNAEAIAEITRQMAHGEGFGWEVLGSGMKAAVVKLGPEAAEAAIHIRGEEIPMHDPRCSPAIATSFLMDATPGRHTQYSAWLDEANFLPPDLGHKPVEDKYNYSGKGETHKYVSSYGHIVNSTGVCMFGWTVAPGPALAEFLSLAMGREFSMEDILLIGERIANLRMGFNLREGARNVEFKIPPRIVGEPALKAGPLADVTVDYETQIREYLEAMGWDTETGVPTAETLNRLGLGYVAEALQSA